MSLTAPAARSLAREQLSSILDRAADPATHAQLAREILALNHQPITAEQLAGYADAMLARAVALPPFDTSRFAFPVIDTCGTGGDSASRCSTFNISTAAALLACACGVPVAKHGNRAATSRCGSADVLEALGIAISASPREAAESLGTHGFVFLFAPAFHPALRPLAPVRKALGVRTVFNLLGPLVNPARPRRQVVGVPARELVPIFAEALALLGAEHAIVVHAADGSDEISLTGTTWVAEARHAAQTTSAPHTQPSELTAHDFALLPHTAPDPYAGGDAAHNAALLQTLFADPASARPEHREVVIANTAAALLAAGAAATWKAGAALAAEALHSGAAARKLEKLQEPL